MTNQQLQEQLPGQLRGVTAILSEAWSIYKQRIWVFVQISIIPTLVSFGGGAGLSYFGYVLSSSKLKVGVVELFIILAIVSIVAIMAILVSQAWGQTALLYAVKDSEEGIGFKEAYRRGRSKILSYWWIVLLVAFIVMGGFILLIVPGIIFGVWFSLALFVLIAEDLKGMDALLKSREYVKGYLGSIFWRMFFIGILVFLVSLAISIIFSLLKIPFASEISRLITGLFLTPLALTYSFLLYRDIKALKSEIAFAPTRGQKSSFIFIGIFGALVIAVLFLVVFSNLDSAKVKSRDALRQAELTKIQASLGLYYIDHNSSYPPSLNELYPKYLESVPVDPSTNQPYQYQLEQDGKDYQVCAQLESTKAQKCVDSQF